MLHKYEKTMRNNPHKDFHGPVKGVVNDPIAQKCSSAKLAGPQKGSMFARAETIGGELQIACWTRFCNLIF